MEVEKVNDRLAQGPFRARRDPTGGPIEIDVIAETYLTQCGAFAEDVGLRPEAPTAYATTFMPLEICGTLCYGAVFLIPP